MSVKLPLLARTTVEDRPLLPLEDLLRYAPHERPRAARAWVAVIGSPGDEAPARFACALSSALGSRERVALLTAGAPDALAAALEASGAVVQRCEQPADASALASCLERVPVGTLVLVVESEVASQLRGVLDVWVGAAPSGAGERAPHLARLFAAAGLVLPAHADGDGVARALAQLLR